MAAASSSSSSSDEFVNSVRSKLHSSWSSWTLTSHFDQQYISNLRHSFDRFETKVKLLILISLVPLEPAKKADCAVEIKKLLQHASEDRTDEWIPVISGLVHSRLFGLNGKAAIEAVSSSQIESAVTSIIEKFLSSLDESSVVPDELEDFYRPPQELRYVSQRCFDGLERSCSETKPFTYTGQVPDFINRDKTTARK